MTLTTTLHLFVNENLTQIQFWRNSNLTWLHRAGDTEADEPGQSSQPNGEETKSGKLTVRWVKLSFIYDVFWKWNLLQ